MCPTGPTTIPAISTNESSLNRSILAIHWIFPTAHGALTVLAKPRILIGRADDCDFILKGTEASRHHAEVIRDGPLYTLSDLGSTNGVFVNGKKIKKAPMIKGNLLRLGEWLGLVVESPIPNTDVFWSVRSIANNFFGGFALASAIEPARQAASTDLPIIIQGETGTGKECMARAIHQWSERKGRFLAVNCAALPEALAEGELFGYRKGAFTGADRSHPGYFRAADNGTLLLDEILDLPALLQAKLLRVLEQREVTPLGEAQAVPVDVRVVSAAQEPLRSAVSEQRFRSDLFARLDGLTVALPPLRERVEDIPGLFARFLKERSGGQPPRVEPKLVEQLCLYDWPFNVRELELQSRRLLAIYGEQPLLRRSHLSEQIRLAGSDANSGQNQATETAEPPQNACADVEGEDRTERDLTKLMAALREYRGNVARAAASIGISRQRAYRIMEGRDDIDLDEFRRPSSNP